MIFRQLFDPETSTYTYLLADEQTRKACLIDAVLEHADRDLRLIQELDLKLAYVLETHIHADHITAAGTLRQRAGARVVASAKGAPCADLHVSDGDVLKVGSVEVKVLATPGHTDDSVSYLVKDRVFTGDALLVRGCGRTDFQNGDAGELYDSIHRVLFTLPDEMLVYPGHDYRGRTVTTIGEEKRHSPRLAGKDKVAFTALMNGLGLPRPGMIDIAVPANRECGRVA